MIKSKCRTGASCRLLWTERDGSLDTAKIAPSITWILSLSMGAVKSATVDMATGIRAPPPNPWMNGR